MGLRVMTVRGPVAPERIGTTLSHEHLFFDLRAHWDPSGLADPDLGSAPFRPEFGGLARWNGAAFRDNLALSADDYDLISTEVGDFVAASGASACVMELSTTGLAPDHRNLRRLSEDLDFHIVAGCGFYVHTTHDEWVEHASVGELTEHLLDVAANGHPSSRGILPGILGEIGTSEELQPCEERVLRAAARVAGSTGLPVNVHANPPELPVVMRILDVLEEEGHPPERTSISHLDEVDDLDYHAAVLDRGAIVGFDSFGQDGYFTPTWKSLSDLTKMRLVAGLVERGYGEQLMLSQDVCKKHHLLTFGGLGYGHVVRRVVPRLQEVFGVEDAIIEQMLVGTPRRLLTIDA